MAEERNFRRAAARLNLSQPALTRQIRILEDDVGLELVDRTTRPIGLTPAGEVFCDEAKQTIAQAVRAVERAHEAHRGQVGRVALGTIGWACNSVVPAVVRAFRDAFPTVKIEVSIMPGREQVDALHADRLDLGLAGGACEDSVVTSERLHEEPLVGVVPVGHRLAGAPSAPPAELLREPLLCISRAVAPGMVDQQTELLRRHGVEHRPPQEAPDIQALLGLVAAGLGVGLQPASTRTLGRQGVAFVPLEPDPPTVSLFMLRRRQEDRDAITTFLDVARTVAPTLGADVLR